MWTRLFRPEGAHPCALVSQGGGDLHLVGGLVLVTDSCRPWVVRPARRHPAWPRPWAAVSCRRRRCSATAADLAMLPASWRDTYEQMQRPLRAAQVDLLVTPKTAGQPCDEHLAPHNPSGGLGPSDGLRRLRRAARPACLARGVERGCAFCAACRRSGRLTGSGGRQACAARHVARDCAVRSPHPLGA